MEVHFTLEQETQLAQIATRAGTDAGRLVKDTILRLIKDEIPFRRPAAELPCEWQPVPTFTATAIWVPTSGNCAAC